jgi:hypothetical protein
MLGVPGRYTHLVRPFQHHTNPPLSNPFLEEHFRQHWLVMDEVERQQRTYNRCAIIKEELAARIASRDGRAPPLRGRMAIIKTRIWTKIPVVGTIDGILGGWYTAKS